MTNKKIGALIPIRLKSERLLSKAIKDICGKPVVCHLLDRAFKSEYLDKENVVVCTTEESSDDELVEVVKNYGASVFRGSTDDIIKRFYDAMNQFNFDAVIQIDGDDVTADTLYMDLTMKKLLSDNSLDIVTCDNLPLGIATKSFTKSAMDKVYEHYKTVNNDTGFIYFFTKTGLCKHEILQPVSERHSDNGARLTLDYDEDFQVFNAIFEALYEEGEVFTLTEINDFLEAHPQVKNLNLSLNDGYWERTKEKAQLYYLDNEGNQKKIIMLDHN